MKLKILVWNINQRSNVGNKEEIPNIVADSLFNRKPLPDIIILTEFAKKSNENYDGFITKLKESSYNFFATNNANNNVLIALKNNINGTIPYCWESSIKNYAPDYIDVTFPFGESFITVVGARILVGGYKYPDGVDDEMQKRLIQNNKIINRISQLKGNIIIGGGDFNTGRRNNKNNFWNKEILAQSLKPLGVKLYTPDGYSHEMHKKIEYRGCPDHIVISEELKVAIEPYNWDFAKNEKYNDFKDMKGEWNKAINNPYPDHGILIAEIDI